MIGNRQSKRIISVVSIMILLIMNTFVSIGEESDLVSIDVSQTKVQMGSSMTLTLTMDASIKAEEIGVEGLENFNVDSTSQSSSSQNINGVKSSNYQYKLTLSPKAIGEFELKAIVNDGNKIYESKPIIMTITKRDESLDQESDDVFIRTLISTTEPYFGENIVLTYELYSRYNLDDFGFLDEVNYDEFIVESTTKEDLESIVVTINDNQYLKKEVKKDVIIPTRSGEYQIPSYRFQANLSTGDFFSRSEPRYLETEPVLINVQELPLDNKPANFTGIIGHLDVKSSVDKAEVAYGDAVTLRVLLTGSGNLESIGKLYSEKQKGFTIYETEKLMEKNIIDLDYVESKEYEIIVVAEDTGNLSLAPIDLWYFDTELQEYKSVEIPEQNILVTGVKNDVTNTQETQTKTDVILINQVNINDDDDDFVTIRFNKKIVLGFVFLLLLVLIVFVVVKKKTTMVVNSHKKEYQKMLKQANSIDMLEKIMEKLIREKTGLNIKSKHRKDIISCFNKEEEKNLADTIIMDFEKDKVNKKQDLQELKEKMKQFIDLVL